MHIHCGCPIRGGCFSLSSSQPAQPSKAHQTTTDQTTTDIMGVKRKQDEMTSEINIDDAQLTAKRTCTVEAQESSSIISHPPIAPSAAIGEWTPNEVDILTDEFLDRKKKLGDTSFDPEQVAQFIKSTPEWKNSGCMAIWRGTVPSSSSHSKSENTHFDSEIEAFFAEECDSKVKYLGAVRTLPDMDKNGNAKPSTGGRCDILLLIHEDSVSRFSIQRFKLGGDRPMWATDFHDTHCYPSSVLTHFSEFFGAGPEDSKTGGGLVKYPGLICADDSDDEEGSSSCSEDEEDEDSECEDL